jgi:hypothetical protein
MTSILLRSFISNRFHTATVTRWPISFALAMSPS